GRTHLVAAGEAGRGVRARSCFHALPSAGEAGQELSAAGDVRVADRAGLRPSEAGGTFERTRVARAGSARIGLDVGWVAAVGCARAILDCSATPARRASR